MAITTLDGIVAGSRPPVEITKGLTGTLVAGRPHSTLFQAGIPGAGVAPSMGLDGEPITSYPGQIPFSNPVSGNTYLARFQGQATQAGTLMLIDRLWHNSGIDVTSLSEQIFESATLIPARDDNGQQIGVGVQAAVEVRTTTGAGVPTLTLKYDNTEGVTQTATNITAINASSIAGTFYPIGLAEGDLGIQRAVSLTLSATWTTGAIGVVLYRVISRLELTAANVPNAVDALTSGFPRLYDNTVPQLVFIPSAATSSVISSQVVFTQG